MQNLKKAKALLISAVLVVTFGAMTAFAGANNPSTQTPKRFEGNVDYWESTFRNSASGATLTDTTGDKKAYIKWTDKETTKSFVLRYKLKASSTGADVTKMRKITYTTQYNDIPSEAISGRQYKLYLTREHALDTKTYVCGYWAP